MTTLEQDLRVTLRTVGWDSPSPALTDHMLRRVDRARVRRRRTSTLLTVLAAATVVGVLVSQLPGRHRPTTIVAAGESCAGLTVASLGAGTAGKETRTLVMSLTQDSSGTRCSVSPADLAVTLRVDGERLDVTQLPSPRRRARRPDPGAGPGRATGVGQLVRRPSEGGPGEPAVPRRERGDHQAVPTDTRLPGQRHAVHHQGLPALDA
jgi:hypothetical protein